MKKFSQLCIFTLTIALTILLILPAAKAIDIQVSGQVNRAVLWGDNGNDDDVKFVDNENSSTRFRFTGSNEFDNNWKVGFKWENQMESNSSIDRDLDEGPNYGTNLGAGNDPFDAEGVMDIGSNDDAGDITFTERHMDIYVEHSRFGKLSLGQGDTASNGTSETDLSGTTVVMYSSISDLAGAFTFRDSDDNVILDAGNNFTFIGNVFSNYDGFSRRDRIRYDTPKFGPVYFSTSYMNGQSYDFAGRFAMEWEGFGKLAAAASLLPAETNRDDFIQYSGSMSFLHSSGLNITGAYGLRDFNDSPRDDAWTAFGKLGYKFGKWALAVDYAYSENVDQDDDEFTSIGFGAVWNPWKSVELYGGYRWHDLDRGDLNALNTGDPEDIHGVMIGTRVKF
jgi:predicted porin